MKLVSIEEARPRQKVAWVVLDLRGDILVEADAELTVELLDRCRQRGVPYLLVQDSEGPVPPPDRPGAQEALERELAHLFEGHESSPAMIALSEAARRYAMARLKP